MVITKKAKDSNIDSTYFEWEVETNYIKRIPLQQNFQ